MRGYFGVGVEGISKSYNLGAVLRTSNAFGASFAFTIGATHSAMEVRRTDTSRSETHMPFYEWETPADLILPKGCQMVGVELTDDMQARCDYLVKIPTKFCINVSLACALALYDRTIMVGGYPDRPVKVGGPDDNWSRPTRKR